MIDDDDEVSGKQLRDWEIESCGGRRSS